MAKILITGANRGIGLELTRQYLSRGDAVVAACRNPQQAEELQALSCESLTIGELELTSKESIRSFCSGLIPRSLSVFIQNAGTYGPRSVKLGLVDREAWARVLEVNTIAPLMLTQKLLPAMDSSDARKLIYISSRMGSIADNSSGDDYIYRTSKTALNQVVKTLSVDLADQGFTVAALHPGWVRTDMGGPGALIDVADSAAGLIQVIDGLSQEESGKFLDHDGNAIPW